jgi:HD-GYP domain-containing protein (c-di-GMP phosphodiesterase class II)
MPILLSIDELEPGMRLYQAIHRGHQVILPAGKVLEDWEINSLRRRFPTLRIRVGDPVLDELADFEDDSVNEDVAITVNRQIGNMMTTVRNKLGSKTALEGSDLAGLQKAIHSVMEYLRDNPVTAAILLHSDNWNTYLQEHAGNVFYLSLLIGNAIRDYVYRERNRMSRAKELAFRYGINLTPLAVGSLLHDIGMLPIESLYGKKEPLTEEELEQIRQHPISGEKMLPKEVDAVARMVVRTHHENFDGTGYPEGRTSDHLHVFSRVVRVADAYDAGTSTHVYKKAKSGARVLWEMMFGPHRGRYDQTAVKILAGLVQPFPIGAKVQMATGQYGVVVRHNRRQPFRPWVIIAFDEEGRKLKKKLLAPPIDLSTHEDVRMAAFGKDDLSFLNQSPTDDVWGKDEILLEEKENESPNELFDFVYP